MCTISITTHNTTTTKFQWPIVELLINFVNNIMRYYIVSNNVITIFIRIFIILLKSVLKFSGKVWTQQNKKIQVEGSISLDADTTTHLWVMSGAWVHAWENHAHSAFIAGVLTVIYSTFKHKLKSISVYNIFICLYCQCHSNTVLWLIFCHDLFCHVWASVIPGLRWGAC